MSAKNKLQLEHNFPKISSPAQRALAGAGYTRLEQLADVTEAEIAQLHGMGPNALGKLRAALAESGLAFARAKSDASEVSMSGSNLPKTSNPAQAALELAGYTRLEHLTTITEAELLAMHGVGPKAVRILREALAESGLSFAAPKSRQK